MQYSFQILRIILQSQLHHLRKRTHHQRGWYMNKTLRIIILIILGIVVMAILAYYNKMSSEASPRNIELVKNNFSKYPWLKPEYDKLNSDGIITNAELMILTKMVKEKKLNNRPQ